MFNACIDNTWCGVGRERGRWTLRQSYVDRFNQFLSTCQLGGGDECDLLKQCFAMTLELNKASASGNFFIPLITVLLSGLQGRFLSPLSMKSEVSFSLFCFFPDFSIESRQNISFWTTASKNLVSLSWEFSQYTVARPSLRHSLFYFYFTSSAFLRDFLKNFFSIPVRFRLES